MITLNPSIALPGTTGNANRADLAEAARGFEAIFLRHMLAAARKTDFGGNDLFGSGGGLATFREMQDSQFADIAAQSGALGLAQVIEAQLARHLDRAG